VHVPPNTRVGLDREEDRKRELYRGAVSVAE